MLIHCSLHFPGASMAEGFATERNQQERHKLASIQKLIFESWKHCRRTDPCAIKSRCRCDRSHHPTIAMGVLPAGIASCVGTNHIRTMQCPSHFVAHTRVSGNASSHYRKRASGGYIAILHCPTNTIGKRCEGGLQYP